MCIAVMDLASYAVTKCTRDDHPVSNLHLQKMLYFLQYVYVRQTDGHLLFEEEFEAWPYGPVMPSVYKKYSHYGGSPIEEIDDNVPPMSLKLKNFIDAGITTLRERSPWDLVQLSHAPGSPWDLVYKGGMGNRQIISNDLIRASVRGSKAARG